MMKAPEFQQLYKQIAECFIEKGLITAPPWADITLTIDILMETDWYLKDREYRETFEVQPDWIKRGLLLCALMAVMEG